MIDLLVHISQYFLNVSYEYRARLVLFLSVEDKRPPNGDALLDTLARDTHAKTKPRRCPPLAARSGSMIAGIENMVCAHAHVWRWRWKSRVALSTQEAHVGK